MPRLPRIYIANCLYYISSFGNEEIFKDGEDYRMYLELLQKYREKYEFKLFSFSLMPSQIDLLMELKEGPTLSDIMHDLNSSYTKHFNARYERKGHLFRERFKSTIAEKEFYLFSLINYIHSRPVELGLVKEQTDYAFSSSLLFLSGSDISKKEAAEGLSEILNMDAEIAEVNGILKKLFPSRKDYADYISGITKLEIDELINKLNKSRILGSQDFVDSVKKQIEERKTPLEEKPTLVRPVIVFALAILIPGVIMAVIYIQKQIIPREVLKLLNRVKPSTEVTAKKDTKEQIPLVALDGTEWTIHLKPKKQIEGTYPRVDRIIFKNGKFSSQHFSFLGYSQSNYGLSVQEDGTFSWETMQKNASGDLVFWRGETTTDAKMSGVMNQKPAQAQAQVFSFESLSYKREE